MTHAARRIALVALVSVACVLSACSTKYGSSSSTATPATTTTIPGSETPAQTKGAELRAHLTYLLVEHVYLLGRVTGEIAGGATPTAPVIPQSAEVTTTTYAGATTTLATGTTLAPSAPPIALAGATDDGTAALDANSHDLADALAAAYTPDFSGRFYALWSTRIADVEAYEKAASDKDKTATAAIQVAMANNITDLAQLFHSVNKYLPVTTQTSPPYGVGDELTSDTSSLTTLLDAQAGGDNAQYADLVTAAEAMAHTADVLADGAAKLDPAQYPGTVTGRASDLRAALTTAFVEHAELTALTEEVVASGSDPGARLAALNANSVQLHNSISAVYGEQAAVKFDSAWSSLIGALSAYGKSKAPIDPQVVHAAASALTPTAATTVDTELTAYVSSLQAVIDGAASDASDEATRIRLAAAHMPGLASTLAEAIAEQFTITYLP